MSRRPGPRVLGLLLALVLGLGGLVLGAAPAYACSCVHQPDDPALVAQADAIFTAMIVADQTVGDTRYLTFAVDRVHKGDAAARQRLTTHAQDSACGLALNDGTGPYLVQGRGTAADLQADLCGGTRPMTAVTGLARVCRPDPARTGHPGRAGVQRSRFCSRAPPWSSSGRPRRSCCDAAVPQPGRKAEPVRSRAPSVTGSRPRRTALINAAWSASVWSAYDRANAARAWSSLSDDPA